MSAIDVYGMVKDSRITNKGTMSIEHRELDAVKAIIIHQTGTVRPTRSLTVTQLVATGRTS